ncbi:MAG: flagellar biosynthetic protein FliQ [Vampirovibrionales bacterium]|nr:flagellar biosynthetic protein FliQ [Vampirovibrionales bacterium]
MELMMEHLGKGMYLILLLSLPAVLLAAGIGLIVGILQAVTQVQEQTISAAPKILLVFLLVIFGGGLMMTLLTNYVRESATLAFEEIPHAERMLMPPKPRDPRRQRIEAFYQRQLRGEPQPKIDALMKSPAADGEKQASGGAVQTGVKPQPKLSVSEQMTLRQAQGPPR